MVYDHEYYENLDSHPSTTERETDFDVIASQADWLKPYYNGSPKYDQVTGVTPGKKYHIHKVLPLGDIADYYFINDDGKEQCLGQFFFEQIKEPVVHPCTGCSHMADGLCERNSCQAIKNN